jgi:hypothetical protein
MFGSEREAFMAARAGYRTVARRTNASPFSGKPGHSFLEAANESAQAPPARLLRSAAFAQRGLGARSRVEPALAATVKMRSCGLFDSVVENSACSLFRLLRAIQALV